MYSTLGLTTSTSTSANSFSNANVEVNPGGSHSFLGMSTYREGLDHGSVWDGRANKVVNLSRPSNPFASLYADGGPRTGVLQKGVGGDATLSRVLSGGRPVTQLVYAQSDKLSRIAEVLRRLCLVPAKQTLSRNEVKRIVCAVFLKMSVQK